MSCAQSLMVLNTSPTAIGVVVCWRMVRNERLVLRGHGILEPEQAVRFEALAEPAGFDRRQPMVDVMQQVHLEPDLAPQPIE